LLTREKNSVCQGNFAKGLRKGVNSTNENRKISEVLGKYLFENSLLAHMSDEPVPVARRLCIYIVLICTACILVWQEVRENCYRLLRR
jgi:hypothetical protein